MEMECLLCLELSTDSANCLDIYAVEWREQNIELLIEKHLLPMSTLKSQSSWICSTCWKSLLEFHQFFRRIEDVHSYFENVVKCEQGIETEECKITEYIQDIVLASNTVVCDPNDNDVFSIIESDVEDNSNEQLPCSNDLKVGDSPSKRNENNSQVYVKSEHENQTSTHAHHEKPQYSCLPPADGSMHRKDPDYRPRTVTPSTPKTLQQHKQYSCPDRVFGETTKYISQEPENDNESTTNSNSEKFNCKYCGKIFTNQNLFVKHTAWHKDNICSCEICDLKFLDLPKLIQHKQIHATKKNADEEANENIFMISCQGQEHMETEIEQADFNINNVTFHCVHCSKLLENERSLSNHIAWHEGNVYCCEICDLRFLDMKKFKIHESAHKIKAGSSKSQIEAYKSKFEDHETDTRSSTTTQLNMNRHEGDIFLCDICDLKFVDASELCKHKSTHATKRKRSCDSSSDKYDLIEELQDDVDHPYQEQLNHNEAVQYVEEHDDETNVTSIISIDLNSSNAQDCGSDKDYIIEEIVDYNEHQDLHQEQLNQNETEQYAAEPDDASNTKSNTSSNVNSNSTMEEIKCKICFKVLKNELAALNHTVWHEGIIYQCNLCELKFFDKTKYENHEMAHITSKETLDSDGEDNIPVEYFACKYCNKVLPTRRLFLNHNAWHVGNIQHCDICDMKFLDKAKFYDHTLTHLPKTMKRCPDCGKGFTDREQVKRHRDKVHRNIVDLHVCDICGKAYRCPISFKRHINVHKGTPDPKLPCDICGRLLANKLCLKSHKLINHPKDGILPYVCEICLKPLATRSFLNRHMLVAHTPGGIDSKCHVCDKTFKNKFDLRKHAVIHTAEPNLPCPWCPEKFFANSTMSRHKRKAHPKEYEEWKINQYVQL